MKRLFDRLLFRLLATLDQLFPGWSERRDESTDHGNLSDESLNYWLTAERCRRNREGWS